MTTAIFRKNLSRLEPAEGSAVELLRGIKQGAEVSVEIRRPRNIKFHRKFFALVRLVYDNQNVCQSQNELLDAIKLMVGHVNQVRLPSGEIAKVPASISFAAMDEPAFNDFWNRAVDVVVRDIIPGLNREDLENEVMQLCL